VESQQFSWLVLHVVDMQWLNIMENAFGWLNLSFWEKNWNVGTYSKNGIL